MAFSAIVSVWATASERYNLLRVVQNPSATDLTIYGEISPTLKSEMKAVLLQLCEGTNTVAGRASILLDALDDLVVTDLDDAVIASQAAISEANTTITLSIAGSVTQTKKTVRVVMPQTLVGIYAGTTSSPGDILLQTGVTPGTYTNATISVRTDGRIEFAESGVGGGGGSISPGSVTASYLASNAVTTAKIAAEAVTDAKIAGVSAAKVTGLAAVATSGAYSDLTGAPAAFSGAYSDLTGTPDLSGYLTSVATANIADGAVTAAKVATNAINDDKISDVTAAKVSGLAAVATSGAYSSLTGRPSLAAVATSGSYTDLSDKPSVAYDVAMDYQLGAPAVNEVMLEVTIPRAITMGAPSDHYVKTLASGERPSTNGGSVLKVYRNATEILSVSYATTGIPTVTEPGGTTRTFAAGDVLKITCTTYDGAAKNHKMTLCATA